MFCNSCGASLAAGVAFCTRCGRPVTETTSPSPPVVKRPTGVTLLAIYDFVVAAITLVFATCLFFFGRGEQEAAAGIAVVASIGGSLGLLRIAAGWGMLVGAGWARILHIVLSVLALINIPVGTAMAIVSFVYLTRPAVKLWFAKSDVSAWTPEEAAVWNRAGVTSMSGGVIAAVLGGVFLVMIPIVGIIAAIAIPNFLNAVDRGKQKRTIADLRGIATAIEAFAVDQDAYPALGAEFVPVEALREALVPTYITAIPASDGWAYPMYVRITEAGYTLVSSGKDGVPDVEGFAYGEGDYGTTDTFNADIVVVNGEFVRYPGGVQD